MHSIFEELYCFDLEDKRKKNLGPTVKWLEKLDGTTRFVVAYVVQAALGGHSIPVDAGTMAALGVLDLVTDKEAAAGEVPGMERAVAKSKGMEFGSLLHQLGADYLANPFSPQVREILLAIDPEASQRFPQRRQPRPEPPPAPLESSAAEVAPPPPAVTPRKKKTEAAAPAKPAAADDKMAEGPVAETVPAETKAVEAKTTEAKAAEAKTAETRTSETKTAEMKPAEGKKPLGAASKKAAEAAHEPSAPEKPHDKVAEKPHDRPLKAEKVEKPEKHSKAEKPERIEKHEKRSAEAAKTPPPAEDLGKRKPR